jgi:DNA-binding NarL/FixJ family response regulator
LAVPASAVEGSCLGVAYFALANALPGQHVIAFAPAGWPDAPTPAGPEQKSFAHDSPLSPREVQVLQLAAEGNSQRADRE